MILSRNLRILPLRSHRPTDVNLLMDHIRVDSLNINFYPHELPPPGVRNLADPLMVITHVNDAGIR